MIRNRPVAVEKKGSHGSSLRSWRILATRRSRGTNWTQSFLAGRCRSRP